MSVQRLDDAALSLLGIVPRAGRTGPKIEPIPLSISVPLIFNLSSASKRQARCPRGRIFWGLCLLIGAEIILGESANTVVWTGLLRSRCEPQRATRKARAR
jgi:hypothetical protein